MPVPYYLPTPPVFVPLPPFIALPFMVPPVFLPFMAPPLMPPVFMPFPPILLVPIPMLLVRMPFPLIPPLIAPLLMPLPPIPALPILYTGDEVPNVMTLKANTNTPTAIRVLFISYPNPSHNGAPGCACSGKARRCCECQSFFVIGLSVYFTPLRSSRMETVFARLSLRIENSLIWK